VITSSTCMRINATSYEDDPERREHGHSRIHIQSSNHVYEVATNKKLCSVRDNCVSPDTSRRALPNPRLTRRASELRRARASRAGHASAPLPGMAATVVHASASQGYCGSETRSKPYPAQDRACVARVSAATRVRAVEAHSTHASARLPGGARASSGASPGSKARRAGRAATPLCSRETQMDRPNAGSRLGQAHQRVYTCAGVRGARHARFREASGRSVRVVRCVLRFESLQN
jgi:hypothetical protein